ncbi:hypothetical protein ACPPVO_33185 [Dactylosporangium sp. McL0621]|uniref:hypothetical protein n=1 Tax=Dactylosporangium sp. McL0621 TaxID=3415678 RepID=UPI003CEDED8C
MTDTGDSARSAPWWPLWALLRGLAVGVASVAVAVGAGLAIIELSSAGDSSCSSDLVCLPDLGPLIFATMLMPVLIAVTGPLVARLLGLARPLLFAVPAAWAVVLACVGLGPADGRHRWPYNSAVSSIVILLVPYCLLALWVSRRPARRPVT